jgi:hypothetical protein
MVHCLAVLKIFVLVIKPTWYCMVHATMEDAVEKYSKDRHNTLNLKISNK